MIKAHLKIIRLLSLFFFLFTLSLSAQNGTVTVNQDPEIDKLLAVKKEVNKSVKHYKIQIYNGSRSGADNAMSNFYQYYSGWSARKVFETPNYKIWVGNFETRLEADRALLRIKRKFANAFIFKPKKDKN